MGKSRKAVSQQTDTGCLPVTRAPPVPQLSPGDSATEGHQGLVGR